MSSLPIISVVISTYNRADKLKRAVQSVLKQTFKQFEIIIVDDASTDKTFKVADKLVKKHQNQIRYIQLPSNWGKHGRPKNVGIKEAQGQFIAFLDDDNEYTIDHLQALYNEFIRQPHIDVVYADRWLINEDTGQKIKGISSDFNTNLLKEQNFIDTSDVLIKKETLLSVGGWDEYLTKFADWNLFVRLAKAGKLFFHVPKILSNYYVHSGMNQLKHQTPINPRTGKPMPTFDPDLVPIWAEQDTFGPKKPLKVAIFTLTHDRLEYTKKTLDSLVQFSDYNYDHFIVDNGSTDGTVNWLEKNRKKYHIKEIIKNPINVGISKGSNQALDTIGNDYDVIMKLDNDCEIQTPHFISDLVYVFERNVRIVVSPNVEGLIDNAGGPPRMGNGYMGELLFGFVPHLGGISIAAPSHVYKNFRWKEDDFLHGMQDTIFSQYCNKVGLVMAYLENQRVMHIDSTYGQKEKFPEYFERRREEKTTKYQTV